MLTLGEASAPSARPAVTLRLVGRKLIAVS
jgi:hypothetical protein